MQQTEVREFVEKYFAAFQSHVVENHPDYVTVKLPEDVDKDIGNRPFYWSWVEKMSIAPQPLHLTLFFPQTEIPKELRAEHIYFGSKRLQQIFESTSKHGRFVCMYEAPKGILQKTSMSTRRSTALTPWLHLNIKVSFICDKKRDFLLSLGVNLHQARVVQDFYPFLKRLHLTPAIPDYFYTLDRRLDIPQAIEMAKKEVYHFLDNQDHSWADQARLRLQEELDILEEYYKHVAQEQEKVSKSVPEGEDDVEDDVEKASEASIEIVPPSPHTKGQNINSIQSETSTTSVTLPDSPSSLGQLLSVKRPTPLADDSTPITLSSSPATMGEHVQKGGRILDFLRLNGIQETPKEQLEQKEWKASSIEEEKERRMSELRWQYEPRVEVKLINGGLFYLFNLPPI
nr:YqhG family protein [Brevibacillus laterosporus]